MTDNTNNLVNIVVPIFFVLVMIALYMIGINILSSSLFIVGFYSIIVILLFFTLGTYIEKLSVNNQLDMFINEFTNQIQGFINTNGGKILPNIPDNFKHNKDDDEIEESNRQILYEAIAFGVIVFFVCLLFSFLLWKFKCRFNYKNMLYHNFILLFFVVVVEVIYFFCLSKNYRILDKNKLYSNLYAQLIEYANGNSP